MTTFDSVAISSGAGTDSKEQVPSTANSAVNSPVTTPTLKAKSIELIIIETKAGGATGSTTSHAASSSSAATTGAAGGVMFGADKHLLAVASPVSGNNSGSATPNAISPSSSTNSLTALLAAASSAGHSHSGSGAASPHDFESKRPRPIIVLREPSDLDTLTPLPENVLKVKKLRTSGSAKLDDEKEVPSIDGEYRLPAQSPHPSSIPILARQTSKQYDLNEGESKVKTQGFDPALMFSPRGNGNGNGGAAAMAAAAAKAKADAEDTGCRDCAESCTIM